MRRKQANGATGDLFDRIASADFGRGGPQAEAELLDLLVEDEAARRAYDETDALWHLLGTVEAPDVDRPERRPLVARLLDPAWAVAIAACLVLAIGAFLLSRPPVDPSHTIETARAERRIARLSDGSTIELSPQSTAVIRFEAGIRRVELSRGEALFLVAPDADRPFVVRAGQGEIQAVGTAFNVRVRGEDVTVTVVEGTVRVSAQARTAQPATAESLVEFVRRGEQVVYESGSPAGAAPAAVAAVMSPPRSVDVDGATAWTRGMLEFRGAPLGEVIDELNRHAPRRILLLDPSLARVRIYGLLRTDDPDSLVELLRDSSALRGRDVETIIRIERVDG